MLFGSALAVLALSGSALAQGSNPTVSTAVFNKIKLYNSFAEAAYADVCATPPANSKIVQYFNNVASDTQATLFTYPAAKQIIISFRGTSTPKDFNTDFAFILVALRAQGTNCPKCKVHSGFQSSWLSIQSSVISAIQSLQAANPSYSLVVTGHSLGGGIAAIAAVSLATIGNKPLVYTYGEPRNGDATWAAYADSVIPTTSYFRVTHANDGVPRLPPGFVDYQHHGTEYWQMPASGISASNTYMCPGSQNQNCNQATNAGNNPINAAHISYSDRVIGNSLYISACGGTTQQIQ